MKNILKFILLLIISQLISFIITFLIKGLFPSLQNPFPIIINLLLTISLVIILWNKQSKSKSSLLVYILVGGGIFGYLGLLLGLGGAILFSPGNNMAPIIGFIYTGPFGFVLGCTGGGIYWNHKRKKNAGVAPQQNSISQK